MQKRERKNFAKGLTNLNVLTLTLFYTLLCTNTPSNYLLLVVMLRCGNGKSQTRPFATIPTSELF
ncbi:CLUMA_CG017515, isoform A [Clunio marinus]|uniref:CLUMA_CG017515, isoform A n=1 Tax=Clunio marinus TaxID=568069 RepID=A0A1J1IZ37_9DIPT|nr:CLUMA_CG017515, isoform A [Clunio marinus]